MPKLATLIKILRDGTKRSGLLKERDKGTGDVAFALRDHYTRLELFWSKKYPKQDRKIVDPSVAKAAIFADRDSTLGILDTITREFITFWMPELEIFIEEDCEDADKYLYTRVVIEIETSIIDVVNRLDCAQSKPAAVLQKALIKLIVSYLQDLFNECKILLNDDERALFDPNKHKSKVRVFEPDTNTSDRIIEESISEARLLNSSIAWEVSDHQEPPPPVLVPVLKSPVKRGFSEAFDDDGPDPADNGAVWDTRQSAKRQKFEVKISKVIDVSDSDDADDDDNQPTATSQPRRILKPVSRSNRSSKITSKSHIASAIKVDAHMELEVPRALKTNDENCILM